MTDTEIKEMKERLLKLKADLLAIADSGREAARPVQLDQTSVGRLSRMDAMQAQSMALAVGKRREEQLARIAGALRRMESDDFGYCFVCGEEIGLDRLRFDPTTTRCVACME